MKRYLSRLLCCLCFHDLRVVQQLSVYAQKVRCRRCERYYAINYAERAFLRWDGEFEAFYCKLLGIRETLR